MSGAAGKALAIGVVNTRRFWRDRSNLFFVFVFPIALVLIIGVQFGGDATPRLGVAGPEGDTARAVLDELGPGDEVEVVRVDEGDLAERVRSTDLDGGVVFPPGLDAAIASGEPVQLGFVAGTTVVGQRLQGDVDRALAAVVAGPTARQALVARGVGPERAAAVVAQVRSEVPTVAVRTETAGERLFPEGTEGLDVAAPGQLVLFTFITGLTASAALIQSRQLGVSTRMLSTPTPVAGIITGEALGRLLVGAIQGLYIMLATLVLFGVDWGDPLGAAAVLAALAAVSAGAAMCFGAFFDQPDQASGIGVVVALAMAAVGGAMLPIELFSDTLATVARSTPHYWALDAFAELIRHDGTVLDIGPQLAVLAAMAAVLLALASWRLRSVLTRP